MPTAELILSKMDVGGDAKRALDDGETLLDGVFALVVDIEGTTTPITFVKVGK